MADLYEWMSTETKEDKKVVFGFDKDGRLYINGERVVTEQKVILQMWLNVAPNHRVSPPLIVRMDGR